MAPPAPPFVPTEQKAISPQSVSLPVQYPQQESVPFLCPFRLPPWGIGAHHLPPLTLYWLFSCILMKTKQLKLSFPPGACGQNLRTLTWLILYKTLTSLIFFSPSSTDSVRNKGGRVFVHCQAGISRSATICLAYLMRTNRVKLDEAFEFVKQRRSIISPNFSFMGQLLQFESQVLASSSCATEAGSPAINNNTVFNFPVSIPVRASASQLSFLHSPITTSPSCWGLCGEQRLCLDFNSQGSLAEDTIGSTVILVSLLRMRLCVSHQICLPNLSVKASSFQRGVSNVPIRQYWS